ncbi:MAG TPA: NifB/NifX family molybdenum-iron cluster-binding protein [Anaerolineales bacterium]|nr:NifB/NifX family molybdenum-iron cluster-binding protein [Anaerolineales bacterium]
MKVAVITDDGSRISQHFGRATFYQVISIENGSIVGRELRNKVGHGQFHGHEHGQDQGHDHGQDHDHGEDAPGVPHGMGQASHDKHLEMAANIDDCEAVICGGMGRGAYQSLLIKGLKPVVTDYSDVDQAALAYAAGTLVDHIDKLH